MLDAMRHRAHRKTVLAVAAGALVLSSCGSASDAGQSSEDGPLLTVPREDMGTFSQNFNPFSPNAAPMTHEAIYERLLIFNPADGETIPWLAESWEAAEDGRSLTYTLREGVSWSDGEEFTAEDVRVSFDLQKELLGGFEYLEEVEAEDSHTVTMHFSEPYSPALYETGQLSIVPAHVWDDHDDPGNDQNPEPVGTGPYTEVTNFQSQSFDLLPNPDYWQEDAQHIPGVRMLAFAGNDGANLAAFNGDVDWAPQYIPDIEETFINRDPENRTFWFPPTGETINWQFNTTLEMFEDSEVRRALSMAIDREQIVEVGMSDYTIPADCTGLAGTYEEWRDPGTAEDCVWTEFDPEAAGEMLDDAGFELDENGVRRLPDGDPFSFDISVGSTSSDWLSVANIISQNLDDIGINATVDSPDWAAVTSDYETGTFESGIVWSAGDPTPYQYFRNLMSTETVSDVGEQTFENYHRFGDERADELLTEFAETSDEAEQMQIMAQLQELYGETVPAVPLFPGPEWGAHTTDNFVGWPSEENPYATLSTRAPTTVLILTTLEPAQ